MLKEKILALLESKDIDALKTLLINLEDVEFLHTFYDLSPEEQVIVFRLLTKDDALTLFEQLDTDQQQNLFRSFTDEKAIELVNELAPDDRVRLLEELPAGVAKKLLNALTPEERKTTNLLLGYAPQTAGRIMTPEYISLKSDMTVMDVISKVRKQATEKETIYNLYITSQSKRLQGVLSLKELLMAEFDDRIADIMNKKTISVSTDTDQEETAKLLQELDLLALPVVDRENRLVGIVTIDDAVDVLEEEATEDILISAGLVANKEAGRSELLIRGSLWDIWKVRLPFLFITLIAGVLAGTVIQGFEDVLESIAAVAIFIPLIMDMGGNVGTQSSTVFARGVALGHIDSSKFAKHFAKEVGIGLSIGILVGVLAGIIAAVWTSIPLLGLAVGFALAVTVTLAGTLGFLVPFVLIKMGLDQAAGSAPIITSIKDIAGLLIYFISVSVFLGYLL